MAVSSDRIRSPLRNERNDSELYQRSTWCLHLTTVATFVRARGVSAGAEVHEIRFTWTGISQIGFVRSRITFFSSAGSHTQTRPSPSKRGNNHEKRNYILESHLKSYKLTFPSKWDRVRSWRHCFTYLRLIFTNRGVVQILMNLDEFSAVLAVGVKIQHLFKVC